MRYCSNCGSKQDDVAFFCSLCGKKLFNSEEKPAPQTEKSSDPSLTKNIVLISICVVLTLLSTIIGKTGGTIGLRNCALWLIVAGIIAFFAIRPSVDHIDTERMNLLKTIESFSISIVYLVPGFFFSDYIAILYLTLVFSFALMTVLKIKKIDIMSQNITEKILLALSIVLLIFSAIEISGFFVLKIFGLFIS